MGKVEGKIRVYDTDSYCFAPLLVGILLTNNKCSHCNKVEADFKSSIYNLCTGCKNKLDEAWYSQVKTCKGFSPNRETGKWEEVEFKPPNIRTMFGITKGFPRKHDKDATEIIRV